MSEKGVLNHAAALTAAHTARIISHTGGLMRLPPLFLFFSSANKDHRRSDPRHIMPIKVFLLYSLTICFAVCSHAGLPKTDHSLI